MHHSALKTLLQICKLLQKLLEDAIVVIVSALNYIVNVLLRGTTALLDDVTVTPAKTLINLSSSDTKLWHRRLREHLMHLERKLEVSKWHL